MDKKKNNENDVDKILGMNRMMFFVIVILICILTLSIGIYSTFFYRYSKKDPFMIGVGIKNSQEEDEINNLRSSFNTIINGTNTNVNNIEGTTTATNIKKLDESKPNLVFTVSDITKTEDNYNIIVKIPKINISSSTTDRINAEINRTFSERARYIMDASNETNYEYKVTYKAYLNGHVLSLLINETEHGGNEAQTTKIYTYNINLMNSSKVSATDVLTAKGYNLQEVQKEIDDEIKELNKKDEDVKKNFSNTNVKIRDTGSSMYKIENTENFVVDNNGYVYILYAYGNTEKTTKTDILIFK